MRLSHGSDDLASPVGIFLEMCTYEVMSLNRRKIKYIEFFLEFHFRKKIILTRYVFSLIFFFFLKLFF